MQPSELKAVKDRLKPLILEQVGEQHAVTAGYFAREFGYKDDRIIRLAIRELRKEIPVLSSGRGYWMPENWKNVHRWADRELDRLRQDALTRRDTVNAAYRYLPPEQLELI